MEPAGAPLIIKKAVCVHEEDTGTAWKHVEYRTGRNDMRRGRRLVLQFVATVANYDYIFCTVLPSSLPRLSKGLEVGCVQKSPTGSADL